MLEILQTLWDCSSFGLLKNWSAYSQLCPLKDTLLHYWTVKAKRLINSKHLSHINGSLTINICSYYILVYVYLYLYHGQIRDFIEIYYFNAQFNCNCDESRIFHLLSLKPFKTKNLNQIAEKMMLLNKAKYINLISHYR